MAIKKPLPGLPITSVQRVLKTPTLEVRGGVIGQTMQPITRGSGSQGGGSGGSDKGGSSK
ncbi:hypothetical protein PHO31112_01649 [Pandoraea horticolens]|uniref:Uncharacterized protein n=1 Tax=Pandoraea horticolens TaxID=2508298 RepID=A0A5E4TUG4_9BURK|nr:hypothetical protein PHO31112_01649 [Pandoraea horticolens]